MNKKIIFFIMILILFSSSLFSQKIEPQILILNSYQKGFKWSDVLIEGVKEALYKSSDPEITTLYMDSKRISSEEYYKKLLELYKIQLKDRHYDIVLLVDKFSYEFALKYYHELFNGEKLVFSGMEYFDAKKVQHYGLEGKVSGVLEQRAIVPIVKTIDTMMPKLKKLYILNDRSSNAKDTDKFIQEAIRKFKNKFAIEYIRDATMAEFENKFSHFNANEAIFFVRFYNGKYKQFYQNREIEAMINKSKLPVFVTDTLFLKEGALGGKLLSIKQIGIDTGNMILKILNNPKMGPIVKINHTYNFMFNYNKLQEFNLDPSLLNAPFKLVNTPKSFFDKNRDFVNIVFVLSPVLVILILLSLYILKLQIKNSKDQEFIVQQAKLAEIGEIISSIAHQWKEPLIEISILVQEHLELKETINNEDKKYIDDIMLQVEYLSETINDFQQFIKPTSQKVIFNIEDAIKKMLNIVDHNMKYNYINITVRTVKKIKLHVNGYPNELMQSLLNIINNSRDAILIKKETIKEYAGKINIDISNIKNQLVIEISDNGGGVKKEHIKRIFNPYYTDKKKGYGIGLYMAKVIIEDKMAGLIDVKNTNDGAKFIIKLELCDENTGT